MKPPNYAGLEGYEGLGGCTTICSHGALSWANKAAVCEGRTLGLINQPRLCCYSRFYLRYAMLFFEKTRLRRAIIGRGCRGFCAVFLIVFFIAGNCGAKKYGAFMTVNAENMGGVYAAGFMPFVN